MQELFAKYWLADEAEPHDAERRQCAEGGAMWAEPDRKWRRLKSHPLWEEIELRLRHHWSPRKVVDWLVTDHPKAKRVSHQTFYRYLHGKPDSWFVSDLVVAGAPKWLHGRVSRLMILEEHAAAIEVMKERLQAILALERGCRRGRHRRRGPIPGVVRTPIVRQPASGPSDPVAAALEGVGARAGRSR